MDIQKIRGMRGRLQFGVLNVAKRATEGRLDVVVANQAIGHSRHIGASHFIGVAHSAVTGLALRGIGQL